MPDRWQGRVARVSGRQGWRQCNGRRHIEACRDRTNPLASRGEWRRRGDSFRWPRRSGQHPVRWRRRSLPCRSWLGPFALVWRWRDRKLARQYTRAPGRRREGRGSGSEAWRTPESILGESMASGERWFGVASRPRKQLTAANLAAPGCWRDSRPQAGRSARRCARSPTSKCRNCGPVCCPRHIS